MQWEINFVLLWGITLLGNSRITTLISFTIPESPHQWNEGPSNLTFFLCHKKPLPKPPKFINNDNQQTSSHTFSGFCHTQSKSHAEAQICNLEDTLDNDILHSFTTKKRCNLKWTAKAPYHEDILSIFIFILLKLQIFFFEWYYEKILQIRVQKCESSISGVNIIKNINKKS